MKKPQNNSQYRPIRPSSVMSADVLDELKVLKALENAETKSN